MDLCSETQGGVKAVRRGFVSSLSQDKLSTTEITFMLKSAQQSLTVVFLFT